MLSCGAAWVGEIDAGGDGTGGGKSLVRLLVASFLTRLGSAPSLVQRRKRFISWWAGEPFLAIAQAKNSRGHLRVGGGNSWCTTTARIKTLFSHPLRVCPGTFLFLTELSEHEANGYRTPAGFALYLTTAIARPATRVESSARRAIAQPTPIGVHDQSVQVTAG